MSAGGELCDRFVETDELCRDASGWRHTLAALAVLFALSPWTAVWSALVLGWMVLCVEGALLARARRRLGRRLAATLLVARDDHRR